SPLCGHTRPGTVEAGALTIWVSSATWKFEIERHLGGPLLRKLQEKRPDLKIRKLAIRIDPGRNPERPTRKPAG
ncbi:MAG: DciA family protein, partial [Kiritimatiellia bacterium]|nr:DciA family protein [Kiritimatiellia bacterium]